MLSQWMSTAGDTWRRWRREWPRRSLETLQANWHLGFTAFGGPPVHFKIFHDQFVLKRSWIDEQLFQELFSISQSLSGPASTKMLYCINLIRDGVPGAVLAFFIWSLPGALGMFGLSIGIANIGDTLPRQVFALLSGLNAATVGIIALAAVELSDQAITDRLTRILVFFTAAAGLLYNALWYFPLLVVSTGCATVVYDYRWLHRPLKAAKGFILRLRKQRETNQEEGISDENGNNRLASASGASHDGPVPQEAEPRIIPRSLRLKFSWKSGILIIAAFLVTFVVTMILRAALANPPMLYKLFANLFLAGTVIFGGGPVVIPLLREYVVAEGWVSPRNFIIGLAITQAFPGPNFNFAVFLGSLAAVNNGYPPIAGAIIGFCGIFFPGIILVHGTMGIWGALRSRPWIKSAVRGVNAGATGLIYTAVYRIWQIGFVDEGFESGKSLGDDPWWVVVSATAYVGGRHFGVSAPMSIALGATMGLIRYAVIASR
ncbi:chromate transporter-domain-containing protein [Mariannaea sp. PMI_226]|nr:chromate transporter-domain-containing protein [Mariannaea sp. PMI_226]